MPPDEVCRLAAAVLYGVATTERDLAVSFAGLASDGRPEHREGRED
jgi:hypothetical protein